MKNPKLLAYRYSNELAGTEMKQQEVELLDQSTENGVTTYIVRTRDGIDCTAIYNPFSYCYYADDIHGVVENYPESKKADMEM